jgi:hypothetical protein
MTRDQTTPNNGCLIRALSIGRSTVSQPDHNIAGGPFAPYRSTRLDRASNAYSTGPVLRSACLAGKFALAHRSKLRFISVLHADPPLLCLFLLRPCSAPTRPSFSTPISGHCAQVHNGGSLRPARLSGLVIWCSFPAVARTAKVGLARSLTRVGCFSFSS